MQQFSGLFFILLFKSLSIQGPCLLSSSLVANGDPALGIFSVLVLQAQAGSASRASGLESSNNLTTPPSFWPFALAGISHPHQVNNPEGQGWGKQLVAFLRQIRQMTKSRQQPLGLGDHQYWTWWCGEHLITCGDKQKENEAFLDLSSKRFQFSSGADSIWSAKTVTNGERLPSKWLGVHQWVLKEEWAKSCKGPPCPR